jgi:hypothetical protein
MSFERIFVLTIRLHKSKGEMMKSLIRSAVLALAVLSIAVPEAVQAQHSRKPAPKPKSHAKKAQPKAASEARWNSMLNSMTVLAHEGAEVKRITAAEKTQIDGTVTKVKQQIASAKKGGISEVEEEAIDTAIANEMIVIAKAMSDDARKKANPIPVPAKK